MHIQTAVIALFLVTSVPHASAQVFKCLGADGKASYSQSPCEKSDSKQQRLSITVAPPPDANAAPAAPAYTLSPGTSTTNATNSTTTSPDQGGPVGLGRLRPAPAPGGPSNAQLIEECEKNRGTRCNTAAEINQRRMEQTPPTPQQQRLWQEIRAAKAEERMNREMSRR